MRKKAVVLILAVILAGVIPVSAYAAVPDTSFEKVLKKTDGKSKKAIEQVQRAGLTLHPARYYTVVDTGERRS